MKPVPERTNQFGQQVGAAVEGWTTRRLPERATIEGRCCQLEPLDPARHADALFQAFAEAPDGRDWTYLPDDPPGDPQAFREAIARMALSPDPLHFAIVVAGEPIGRAALMRMDPANGAIEIGHIAFAPKLKRTRAGTEAIFLLMTRAFELGYRRLEWKCDSRNEPSRRAARRYGFTFEGIFRQAVVTKGRNRDTAWFSIIDEEWPEVRRHLSEWVAPDNFDGGGRQRTALGAARA